MAGFTVHFDTHASASVTVDIDDDVIAKHQAEGTIEELKEIITDEAYNHIPSICAQCSGWRSKYSLEVGDEWELSDYQSDLDKLDPEEEKDE